MAVAWRGRGFAYGFDKVKHDGLSAGAHFAVGIAAVLLGSIPVLEPLQKSGGNDFAWFQFIPRGGHHKSPFNG